MDDSDFGAKPITDPNRMPGPIVMNPTASRSLSRSLFFSGIGGVLLVLLIYVTIADRLVTWEDEIFVVSAGLSIARSQAPIESVMALYPHSDSPIKFYGPVSFEAAAQLIRVFGLKTGPWRLACFGGIFLNLLVAVGLVRLGGGDDWAQLITALTLAISGFAAAMQPGRWDFVSSGLFLSGLLVLLAGIEAGGTALVWRVAVAGPLIGLALGSTPRVLTFALAAAVTVSLVALLFSGMRKHLLLGALGAAALAVLTQNLLLLPWHLNSLSWYAYVRSSTRKDPHNATPVTGTGGWGLNFQNHKTLILVALCLFAASLCSVLPRVRAVPMGRKLAFRFFLASFAMTNLLLMLLLTRGSLGLSGFWLTPVVVAIMCWFDWDSVSETKWGILAATLVGTALTALVFQAVRPLAATALTWNRRSNGIVAAFVRRTTPNNAALYGPIGGYFYPAEMAGRTYLYLYEQERGIIPWLPANPHTDPSVSVNEELDEQSCTQPIYVIWPIDDPARHSLAEPMPKTLQERLGPKISELRQPPLTKWKEGLLDELGGLAGKYGLSDVAIFRLRTSAICGKG